MSLSRIVFVRIPRMSDAPGGPLSILAGGFFSLFLSIFFSCTPLPAQQQPSMPGMQMQHEHSEATSQSRKLEFPRLGRAQSDGKESLFTIDHALETARQNNPTLHQAEAGIRAARARAQQAALYPNPTVGYAGDEIRGG